MISRLVFKCFWLSHPLDNIKNIWAFQLLLGEQNNIALSILNKGFGRNCRGGRKNSTVTHTQTWSPPWPKPDLHRETQSTPKRPPPIRTQQLLKQPTTLNPVTTNSTQPKTTEKETEKREKKNQNREKRGETENER